MGSGQGYWIDKQNEEEMERIARLGDTIKQSVSHVENRTVGAIVEKQIQILNSICEKEPLRASVHHELKIMESTLRMLAYPLSGGEG